MKLQALYQLAMVTDTLILIVDQNGARSVANDAEHVVRRIDVEVGGIGRRRLFYRDTAGRFDELRVVNGQFDGFSPCSAHQQAIFATWLQEQ